MFKLSPQTKQDLWWLIISVDYHYHRIAIADYEFTGTHLTLWLEDKQDYKNSLDECLELHISLRNFAALIRTEKLNTYEATCMHPDKQFLYAATIEINKPLKWYQQDATAVEQRWAREAALKAVLTQLIENELSLQYNYAI